MEQCERCHRDIYNDQQAYLQRVHSVREEDGEPMVEDLRVCDECMMNEDMGECPKCDCAVKRCDLATRPLDETTEYYLDVCRKCDEEEDDDDDDDCICESNENPNPLCPDHQCCWACSTQSVPITLNEHSRLWLCDGCNDKGEWCRHCRKTGECECECECEQPTEVYNGSKDFPPNETDETCPICLEAYDREIGRLKDGIRNSDCESNCPHWCCSMCWDKMYRQDNDTDCCPICKRDITDWLKTHYDNDDDDEYDSDDDNE